jgi:hypothetical protein
MPGAQPTGKKVPSSSQNQNASSIVIYMMYRPHGRPRLPSPLKAKFAKKNVGSCKLKVIIKTPSTGAAAQRQEPALE